MMLLVLEETECYFRYFKYPGFLCLSAFGWKVWAPFHFFLFLSVGKKQIYIHLMEVSVHRTNGSNLAYQF